MNRQDLSNDVHFNLIPLLNALLRTKSVTGAARELGISQPAASQGLARLRIQMQDPLLVSISGKMQLTPFAGTITGRLDNLVTEIDELLHPSSFQPENSIRSLTIATNDYLSHLFAIAIVKNIQEQAPRTKVQLVDFGVDFADRMAAREIDFALLPALAVHYFTAAPLRYRRLLQDPPVVMMDKNHPLTSLTKISKEDLAKYKQVLFHVDAIDRTAPLESYLNPFECKEEMIGIKTDLVTLIPGLIEGTDMISVLSYNLASKLSSEIEIRHLESGYECIDFGFAWSPVFDADPAHIWFRKLIEKTVVS